MRHIEMEYQSMALPYDRILMEGPITVNMSDTKWNWLLNMPCKSLKGVQVLFAAEDEAKADFMTQR